MSIRCESSSSLFESSAYILVEDKERISFRTEMINSTGIKVLKILSRNLKSFSDSEIKIKIRQKSLILNLLGCGLQTPLQAEKFNYLVNLYERLEIELLNDPNNAPIPFYHVLSGGKSSPLYIEYINYYEKKKKKEVDLILKSFFSYVLITYWLKCEELTMESFSTIMENSQRLHLKRAEFQMAIAKLKAEFYRNEIEFFTTWGTSLKSEMVQGLEDPNEIIQKGVCLGFAQRIFFTGLKNPSITIKEVIQAMKITPLDRYTQAAYVINFLLKNDNHNREPEDVEPYYFIKHKIYGEILFERLYNPYLSNLDDLLNLGLHRLAESNGWLQLDLYTLISKHVILLRWDELRQHFWLIDPNLGLFAFEDPRVETEKSKSDCIQCLGQILSIFYPYTYKVKGLIYTIN